MNKIKTIAVFCGALNGNNPDYAKSAYQLGKYLAENSINLVYGGGSRGLMGQVAKGCRENNGHITGVIPKLLNDIPSVQAGLYENELIVTKNMHERKMTMFEKADAFIALPGGIGTFEEILEQTTWIQLKIHNKPCGLLNINGYYDKLKDFLDFSVETGFVNKDIVNALIFDDDVSRMVEKLCKAEINLPPKIR